MMRRSSMRRYAVWAGTAMLAGALGLGRAWADKGGSPNEHSNNDAGEHAKGNNSCVGLPSHAALKAALDAATATEASGLNLHMWATLVDRDGVVCAVAFPAPIVARSGRGAESFTHRRPIRQMLSVWTVLQITRAQARRLG